MIGMLGSSEQDLARRATGAVACGNFKSVETVVPVGVPRDLLECCVDGVADDELGATERAEVSDEYQRVVTFAAQSCGVAGVRDTVEDSPGERRSSPSGCRVQRR